jgi:ABC-type uncharacterized transport system involved in gliding motility auxiliary subunit
MSKWGKISYLVCGLSIIVLFVARFLLQGWVDLLYIPLALSLGAFIAAWAVDYKFYLDFLSMKTTKHGMNMGLMILLGLILVVAVNFLGVRFDKTLDVTKEKINSLSEQSESVVKNLKDDLNVRIFYRGRNFKERAREIQSDFRLYQALSGKVKVQTVDAQTDVETAKKYLDNSEAFATIIEYKGKKLPIPSEGGPERPVYQEKNITSTFMKITRDQAMTIHFVTGHGEKDIDNSGLDGLKTLADALRDDGYTVTKINLLLGDKMPSPPDVLAIVGPKNAYSDKEIDQIREFADKGGRLFVAIDPGEKHGLALLTKPFGVEFRNNFILNEVAGTDEGLIGAVGFEFDSASEITKALTQGRSLVVFPYASELAKAPDAPSQYTYTDLVKSHPRSYTAASPMAPKSEPERKQSTMAMSVKSDKFAGVFFGDSDFLINGTIQKWMHGDLALNSVAYLFNDEMNLTIRPKNLEATPLQITKQKGIFIIAAGVSLPLLLIVLSGLFWYRRRNL